ADAGGAWRRRLGPVDGGHRGPDPRRLARHYPHRSRRRGRCLRHRDCRVAARAVQRARERPRGPRSASPGQGRTRCRATCAASAARDPGNGAVMRDGAAMPATRRGAAMDDNDLARAGQLPADPAEGTAESPRDPPPTSGTQTTIDGPEDGGKAKRLAALIQQRAELVLSPTGRSYALTGRVARPVDSDDFIGWCSHEFWQEHDGILTRSMIDDVVRALGGPGLPTRPIHIRVGGDLSRITLDLGDSAVAVTAQGILPAPDAVFARPKGTLSLPAPRPRRHWKSCVTCSASSRKRGSSASPGSSPRFGRKAPTRSSTCVASKA